MHRSRETTGAAASTPASPRERRENERRIDATVVVPALNEARSIEACIRSVTRQRHAGALEVIVVDGRSEDGTAELARRAGARVIDNPERTIPAALNRGLAAASGDVLVRFDAHGEMPQGYIAACVDALLADDGAVAVGGWLRVEPAGPWGRALGDALASPYGIGNPDLWRRPARGARRHDRDTVPFGAYRTAALRRVGGWNPALLANEDFELNFRLRAAGGRIVFDPAIWSIYRPRESLTAIARQFWRYGRWKAAMLVGSPRSLRPRQVAPPALLAVALAAVLPTRLARPARRLLGCYGIALAGVAGRSRSGWRTAPVLLTIHLAWAAGLVHALALARLARPRVTPDPPSRERTSTSVEAAPSEHVEATSRPAPTARIVATVPTGGSRPDATPTRAEER